MRIKEDDRPKKRYPEEGKTHYGVITEYKYQSFTSKKTGKPLKGLRITIRPNDPNYFTVSAFGWIGEDDQGLYIYKGSVLEEWIKRVLNVPDLSTIRLDSIIGANCLFTVKITKSEHPDTHQIKEFCNVTDIMSLPSNIPVMPAAAPNMVNQVPNAGTAAIDPTFNKIPTYWTQDTQVNPVTPTAVPTHPNVTSGGTRVQTKSAPVDTLADGDLL
jgi:hypothetical protein